jgi:flavin reductase (DIM6/NTAB) family NADH-FMN oxidoreductase RutF
MGVRIELPPSWAHRLIRHGPATWITSSHGGQLVCAPADWAAPLEVTPPSVMVRVPKGVLLRRVIEASGQLTLSVATVAMVDVLAEPPAEPSRLGLLTAHRVTAPHVAACLGWLECEVRPSDGVRGADGLLVCDVVAAWAEERAFRDGQWRFGDDAHRTVHMAASGAFFATGERVDARLSARGR